MTTSRFRLCPIPDGLADPAWLLSWYRGPCETLAASVEEARWLAAGRYTIAAQKDPRLASQVSPWLDSSLVAVEPVTADQGELSPGGVA
jgi:hypothetical protein